MATAATAEAATGVKLAEESHGTGASTNKYDRQLRLWNTYGQRALAQTSLLLIGCGPAGTESLKNLILPGVGDKIEKAVGAQVALVDDKRVTEADVGNNFFLYSSDKKKTRAEAAAPRLAELNPDSRVVSLPHTVEDACKDQSLLTKFTLVIGNHLLPAYARILAANCEKIGIPLILCRCYGLLGQVRILTPPHVVSETRPTFEKFHLHLWESFSQLEGICDATDLEKGSFQTFAKTPYAVILAKELAKIKAKKGGKPPTWGELRALQKELKATAKTRVDRENESRSKAKAKAKDSDEDSDQVLLFPEAVENWEEAWKNTTKDCSPYELPSSEGFTNVFDCDKSSKTPLPSGCGSDEEFVKLEGCVQMRLVRSTMLWLAIRALKVFYKDTGRLPVPGKLPDMEASADTYRTLQSAYTSKAKEDIALFTKVLNRVQAGLESEWSTGFSKDFFSKLTPSAAYVTNFVKNANNIELLKFRSFGDQLAAKSLPWMEDPEELCAHVVPSTDTSAAWETDDGEFGLELVKPDAMEPFLWYVLLRAADDFQDHHGHYPGYTKDTLEADRKAIQPFVDRIVKLYKLPATWITKDHVHEIVRFGAAEVHPVAAFVGGAVSHVAVMLITHQYRPFNNNFIYNGINGRVNVFEV